MSSSYMALPTVRAGEASAISGEERLQGNHRSRAAHLSRLSQTMSSRQSEYAIERVARELVTDPHLHGGMSTPWLLVAPEKNPAEGPEAAGMTPMSRHDGPLWFGPSPRPFSRRDKQACGLLPRPGAPR
jgi:hypothetical protein